VLYLERPQQLGHQQRIPARRLPAHLAELGSNLLPEAVRQHLAQRGLAQRPRMQDLSDRIQHQCIHCRSGLRFASAIGQRQCDSHPPEAPGQKLQVAERGVVAPDDVVDADQHRRVAREVGRQPVEGM
jgi:hypothetical protein